jgi:hypothetical protein
MPPPAHALPGCARTEAEAGAEVPTASILIFMVIPFRLLENPAGPED